MLITYFKILHYENNGVRRDARHLEVGMLMFIIYHLDFSECLISLTMFSFKGFISLRLPLLYRVTQDVTVALVFKIQTTAKCTHDAALCNWKNTST